MAVSPAAPAAASAAAALGGGSSVARAILAQWVCENGDLWPPPDNNPGNITIGALTSNGIRDGYTTGRTVKGHVFARWPNVAAGVAGYVRYVNASPRWVGARAAARLDNGYGFLTGLVAGGWGTGLSCSAGAYRSGRGPSGSAAGSGTSGGGGIVLVGGPGSDAGLCAWNGLVCFPRGHIITKSDTNAILDKLDSTGVFGSPIDILAGSKAETYNALQTLVGKPWDEAALAALGTTLNQKADQAKPTSLIDFSWVPGVAVNTAVLAVILLLAYKGIQELVEP